MRIFRLFCLFACLALTDGAAEAHAIVLNSTPRPDATVKGESIAIEIRFNSRIDAGRSHIKLVKLDGDVVSLPLANSASEDTLQATATGLAPGGYRLHWQTLSPDGHITQGDIPFRVSR
ncbi:copper resistance CopC family protein [Methylocystis echinoides]|jgi:methionine-rich copper-binding protein CopC|uniref:copper resistance CopC family protein n=1 Tax=Methylocystis echinoides TaxID=29468 RepID=UPI003431BDD8